MIECQQCGFPYVPSCSYCAGKEKKHLISRLYAAEDAIMCLTALDNGSEMKAREALKKWQEIKRKKIHETF